MENCKNYFAKKIKLNGFEKKIKTNVTIVTFRRQHLLKRAAKSVLSQTHKDWTCSILNDDPLDRGPEAVIRELNDNRFQLHQPIQKRGPARAFNEAFKADRCEFASLLEDDNWWEPLFLEKMIEILKKNPNVDIACGNEKIWKEKDDGIWENTNQTIWSFDGWRYYKTSQEDACGSAKICNSSLLVRRRDCSAYLTPDDIPVDVTEHFRERTIKQPFILYGRALVNYAETKTTNRSIKGTLWSEYQAMLIASVFASISHQDREVLARKLFTEQGRATSPRVSSLISAAFCSRDALSLWRNASSFQRLKFLLTCARRPLVLPKLKTLTSRRRRHWEFLINSPWNRLINSKNL